MDKQWHAAFETELTENILPFWQRMADPSGGFYGKADFFGNIDPGANRGGVLCARILWTFSAAFRATNEPIYRKMAAHAQDYLLAHFYDHTYGGVYWMLDAAGQPVSDKKQFYNLAFAVYGLSEHYRATGDETSLQAAVELFETLERYGHDAAYGGYIEAAARDFSPLADTRLSLKDVACDKSMNTNLHVLEAYTNLYRVYPNERVKTRLHELIRLFLDHIIDPATAHLHLFFDRTWHNLSAHVSYGHDIECSWLLIEAAEVLGDAALLAEVTQRCIQMAEAVYAEGMDHETGYLADGLDEHGVLRTHTEWWVEAEHVVGMYQAWQSTGDAKYRDAAQQTWQLINRSLIDHVRGGWHCQIDADGIPSTNTPKADEWKCPYHNSRMCLEMMARLEKSEI